MTVVVAQLGARRHYAIPHMLYQAGMLEHFYTDICAVKSWPRLLRSVPKTLRPVSLERLIGRIPNNLPREKITSFPRFGWQYARRRAASLTTSETQMVHLWAGKRFCELVTQGGFRDGSTIYTFNSAGLELLQAARALGIHTVMEQTIAPQEIECILISEEQETFPQWEPPLPVDDQGINDLAAREREEWNNSDLILCGSEFVRDSIAVCNGPIERCVVVPYGVDMRFCTLERKQHDGPLRVLTVGSVGLRKGLPYVLRVAQQLRGKAEFRVVGPIKVLPAVQAELRSVLELTGPVPRSEILTHYGWADAFLLPSLCEGSATAVYEALATGLPVICTPNTGSVVRDGVDGFIVPVRDADAIAEKLELLHRERDLLRIMARNASQQATNFTLAAYSQRLIRSLSTIKFSLMSL